MGQVQRRSSVSRWPGRPRRLPPEGPRRRRGLDRLQFHLAPPIASPKAPLSTYPTLFSYPTGRQCEMGSRSKAGLDLPHLRQIGGPFLAPATHFSHGQNRLRRHASPSSARAVGGQRKISPIAGMIWWPTIAMGSLMPAVSRNRGDIIVR